MYTKRLFIAVACACTAGFTAMAQDAETNRFKTRLNAGVTLTEGNSKTVQANASLVTKGQKKSLGSVRAGVEGNYGESTVDDMKDRTIANVKAYVNAKKTITRMTFWSFSAEALYDEIAKIDYRFILSPGIGAYLVKNDTLSLSVDAGPAYVWQKVDGVSDDYPALRFGERFDLALSETAKCWQSLEFVPRADDFDDYFLNAEAGIEAAINSHLSLRLVIQDKYDNIPAPGKKQNDLTVIAGVGVSL